MNKLFEVPYNFDFELIPFYKKQISNISYVYLPPYKDDLKNTRTYLQSDIKGFCYMPVTRHEYEQHVKALNDMNLKYLILWQDRNCTITEKELQYYTSLGASGFTVANDKNAQIIKDYCSDLIVVSSIVRRLTNDISKTDFSFYDKIILSFPFNRALDALKELDCLKDKITLMPNTLCHIDCPAVHHWNADDLHPFNPHTDCCALKDIHNSAFIAPEHLYLFDELVDGYKLQGREYSTEVLKYICQIYFKRECYYDYLDIMLGDTLAQQLNHAISSHSIYDYYNIRSLDLIRII